MQNTTLVFRTRTPEQRKAVCALINAFRSKGKLEVPLVYEKNAAAIHVEFGAEGVINYGYNSNEAGSPEIATDWYIANGYAKFAVDSRKAESIIIGGHTVEAGADGVQVGCTFVSWETLDKVRALKQ